MKWSFERVLYWSPRILGLLFAAFVSLFALDVFDMGLSFRETLLALFMHLIPVYVLLVGLVIAWRWEWAGALTFIGFSIWYMASAWGTWEWSVILLIAFPPLLIGILFLIHILQFRHRQPATHTT